MDPECPDLELVIGGRPVRFPAVWLRDNCPCPDCLAPGTGQKRCDITDIPNGLAITHTEDAGESVLVAFAPDRHRSAFPRSWLEEHAPGGERDGDGRTEDDKELWLPADLDRLPAMSWPSYLAGGKAEALEAVLGLGFVLLSGVPGEPGTVLEVAASFGYVRETNYGRQLNLRLAPGDCLVFDNTRVLHARTAFSMDAGSPGRHLQGCYADLDGLASTLAVLSRSGNHGREESR